MLNLNSFLLFSENPSDLADFYKQVFEKEPDWTGGDYYGFQLGSGFLTIGPHKEVHGMNENPERMMVNFETNSVENEFERIRDLGATVVAKPYNPGEDGRMTIATFADPDGNYFQLMSPMDMPNGNGVN